MVAGLKFICNKAKLFRPIVDLSHIDVSTIFEAFMSQPINISANPSAKKSSTILMERQLKQVGAAFERSNVVCCYGPALSGRSTLLKQWVQYESSPKIRSIDISHELTLKDFLSQLAHLLELKAKPEADSLFLMEIVLEALREDIFILVIDNLNLVEGHSKFLEALVQKPINSRVLFSSDAVPTLRDDLILEIGLVKHSGFDLNQLGELATKLQFEIKSDSHEVLEKILEATDGNPYKIRIIFSHLLMEQKELNLETLEEAVKVSDQKLALRVVESLSDAAKRVLNLAARFEFDQLSESQALSKLDIATRRFLVASGFLKDMGAGLSMGESFRSVLLKTKLDQAALLEDLELASQAPMATHLLLDLIHAFRSFGLEVRATALICQHPQLMIQAGPKVLLRETESCKELIPFELRLSRLQYMEADRRNDEALAEADKFLRRDLSTKELAQAEMQLAHIYYSFDRVEEAVILDIQAANRLLDSEPLKILALSFAAKHRSISRPREALSLIRQAEALFRMNSNVPGNIKGEFYFSYAFVCNYLGEWEEKLKWARLALKEFEGLGNLGRCLIVEASYWLGVLDSGRLDEALAGKARLIERYRAAGEDVSMSQEQMLRSLGYLLKGHFRDVNNSLDSVRNDGGSFRGIYAYNYLINDCLASTHLLNSRRMQDSAQSLAQSRLPVYALIASEYKLMSELYEKRVSFDAVFNRRRLDQLRESLGTAERGAEIAWGLMQVALNFGFPRDLPIQYFEKLLEARGIPVGVELNLRALVGLFHLLHGNLSQARDQFERVYGASCSSQLPLARARSLIGLCLLSKNAKSELETKMYLDELKLLKPELQTEVDIELIDSLEKLSSLEDKIELDNLEFRGRFRILASLLGGKSSGDSDLSEDWLYFCGRIAQLWGLEGLQKSIIRTRDRVESSVGDLSIAKLKKRFELLYDGRDKKLYIRGKEIDLSQSKTLIEILKHLLMNPEKGFSKEDFATFIWQEIYNPLSHDSRTYTSIKRLRALIEPLLAKDLLESTAEGKYQIAKDIKFALIQSESLIQELSANQDWILRFVETHGSIKRQDVQDHLKLSRTPAALELKALVDRGLLKTEGKARAQCYVRV